jgi:hypothetical protein
MDELQSKIFHFQECWILHEHTCWAGANATAELVRARRRAITFILAVELNIIVV